MVKKGVLIAGKRRQDEKEMEAARKQAQQQNR